MVEQKDQTLQIENQEAKQEKSLIDLKQENQEVQNQIDRILAENPETKNGPEYQKFTRLDAGVNALQEVSLETAVAVFKNQVDTHKNLTLLQIELGNPQKVA